MGRIIHLFGDRHPDAQRLLPWYVTGQLDPSEREAVDAHLADCGECQHELQEERRLRGAISTLQLDLDTVWTEDRDPKQHPPRISVPSRFGPRVLGWFLAGQCAVALLLMLLLAPNRETTLYSGLGSASVEAPGAMVIMFRPDASEQAIRDTLTRSGARIVDGPTSTGAYVLSIPAAKRTAVLQELRTAPAVVLAEPMDPEERR